MTFESFYEIYSEYKRQRVKESTFETKSHIVRTKILPYFGKRKINEITVADVITWQNEMMAYRDEKGKPYSVDYLKTIQAQLTAIFNHAVNYYNLPSNPARQAGSMGKEVPKEMKFWTKEQYLKFAEAMMASPDPTMPLRCCTGPESGKESYLPSHRQILILRNTQCGSIKPTIG